MADNPPLVNFKIPQSIQGRLTKDCRWQSFRAGKSVAVLHAYLTTRSAVENGLGVRSAVTLSVRAAAILREPFGKCRREWLRTREFRIGSWRLVGRLGVRFLLG